MPCTPLFPIPHPLDIRYSCKHHNPSIDKFNNKRKYMYSTRQKLSEYSMRWLFEGDTFPVFLKGRHEKFSIKLMAFQCKLG